MYLLRDCNLKAFEQQCKRHLNACICMSAQRKHICLMALYYSLLWGNMGGGGKAFFHVKVNSTSEAPCSFALLFGFIILTCVSQKKLGDN